MNHSKKGVNLGGWLVIEKWITPSLFMHTSATNEAELVSMEDGINIVKRHHEFFITVDDLDWIQAQKIELIRVPIGHWVFGDVPPYAGSIERLDWLFDETEARGIGILIDMHAAPGGQNNEEHGGMHESVRTSSWLADKQSQYATINVLQRLAKRYGHRTNLWGLQLLNEPMPGRFGLRLARFYREAFNSVKVHLRDGVYTVFSDGYAPYRLTNCLGLMGSSRHPVAIDCHLYYCFSAKDKKLSFDEHIAKVHRSKALIRLLSYFQPVVIGEWSAILPYESTKSQTQAFVTAQSSAYKNTIATYYWNYKTEAPGRWNFRNMVEKGKYVI